MTRICKKCLLEKRESEFADAYWCKSCKSIWQKKYHKKNKDKLAKKRREYLKKNKEKIAKKRRKYREKNKEKLSKKRREYYEKNKEKMREATRKWKEKNREKVRETERMYRAKRKQKDSLFLLASNTRDLIRRSYKRRGGRKGTKTSKILGCDFNTFQAYLKKTFEINYGENINKDENTHLDHIIPISTASCEKNLLFLNHFTNFQLLTAEDNMRKGNSLEWQSNWQKLPQEEKEKVYKELGVGTTSISTTI